MDTTALKLSSVLLGSTRPTELKEWYRRHLAPGHTGDGPIGFGGFLLVIDGRDDVDEKNNEPGRAIFNFHVEAIDEVERRLVDGGVEFLVPVEQRANGRFGTFVDPDGNRLQLIQFDSEDHR
jgi:hypothetical protein